MEKYFPVKKQTFVDNLYARRLKPNPSSPSPLNITNINASIHHQSNTPDSAMSGRRHIRAVSDTTAIYEEFRASPSPARQENVLYSDRYIPSRTASNLENAFISLEESESKREKTFNSSDSKENDTSSSTYSLLLRNELLGTSIAHPPPASSVAGESASPQKMPRARTFRFQSPSKSAAVESPYAVSPVGVDTQRLLSSPRKPQRKIAKLPFKVLDAPVLKDDFYLNLVDWSAQNVLAVGLGSCVYLWSACTSKVTKLCDVSSSNDYVTSVSWTSRGTLLAVGTRNGEVQIWDGSKCRLVRKMGGHQARVGALAWNSRLLASGSRDRHIYLRDGRCAEDFVNKLTGHKQEVCGLRWSFDEQQLASGGNDNKLLIWNAQNSTPVLRFGEHIAAVKAIAWSPHQHGLLSSGGGTADRCIKFWNTLTGTMLNSVDTGSQVCNLLWSKNVNEIVSTHGYSLNQIIVWKYPSMQKLATLTGHTYRVLYLAASPDGQTIVTGAGDETLRFWNVFPSSKTKSNSRLGAKFFFSSSSEIR